VTANTKNIRKNILKMTNYSSASHIGAALSAVEILYVLYFKIMKITSENVSQTERDKFIMSKGHACVALYATLAEKGLMPTEYLDRYYIDDGILTGHLDNNSIAGVDCAAGSLGHGLSVGIGMALAKPQYNVYVLMGDGECDEGSVWEALMLLAQLQLKNITVIIDENKLQGFGYTKDIINQSNLAQKIAPFGLDVIEVDGHDLIELEKAFNTKTDKPKAIIAHTIKGKGVSFMENELKWHYKSPNDEELQIALAEVDAL
jgi:transketolase